MSKASEYARKFRENAKPEYKIMAVGNIVSAASVTWDGKLHLDSTVITAITPADRALELARWIIDTFGEME